MDDHGSSLSLAIISSAGYIPGLPLTRPPVAGHFSLVYACGIYVTSTAPYPSMMLVAYTKSVSSNIRRGSRSNHSIESVEVPLLYGRSCLLLGLALDGVAGTLLRRIVCAAVVRVILLY